MDALMEALERSVWLNAGGSAPHHAGYAGNAVATDKPSDVIAGGGETHRGLRAAKEEVLWSHTPNTARCRHRGVRDHLVWM